MNTLLDLLKYRFKIAEGFTQEQHKEVERCVDDYECADGKKGALGKVSAQNTVRAAMDSEGRYLIKIPYIFATHESMLASFFDREPDLVFRGRGQQDYQKEEKIKAAYDYIVDKVDFPLFMNESAWWFILTGNAYGGAIFKSETKEVPILDEMGQPQVDETTGKPATRVVYTYNDPIVYSYDPMKLYFSPESKFKENAKEVPYFFFKTQMELDEIKNVYKEEVEADATLKVDMGNSRENEEDADIKRATVYFYQGQIPETYKKEVKGWRYGAVYSCIFTGTKILHKEILNDKTMRLGAWYRVPNKFFGFGIGKTLREFQKEIMIRRSQQVRFADLNAFPKIAVDMKQEVDDKALLDPRADVVLLYKDKAPSYLVPPEMNQTIVAMDELARKDAQFVSGMMDISSASQSSTVNTATGQTIFADAAERRIRQSKRQYGRFIREMVILLLKLAQENWDEEKMIQITDEEGNQKEILVTKQDLSDIDFDSDIDVDMENVSINKDVLRAQSIELYDRIKDDPLVDRPKVFKYMLRNGFNEKNPENFLKSEEELAMEQMGQQGMMNPQAQAGMPIDGGQGMPSPDGSPIPQDQQSVASSPFQGLM